MMFVMDDFCKPDDKVNILQSLSARWIYKTDLCSENQMNLIIFSVKTAHVVVAQDRK